MPSSLALCRSALPCRSVLFLCCVLFSACRPSPPPLLRVGCLVFPLPTWAHQAELAKLQQRNTDTKQRSGKGDNTLRTTNDRTEGRYGGETNHHTHTHTCAIHNPTPQLLPTLGLTPLPVSCLLCVSPRRTFLSTRQSPKADRQPTFTQEEAFTHTSTYDTYQHILSPTHSSPLDRIRCIESLFLFLDSSSPSCYTPPHHG